MSAIIYLLNSPIMTSHGVFSYSPISESVARDICQDKTIMSFIGHEATAGALSLILQKEVYVNRGEFYQESGDVAIVFSLKRRLAEGEVIKSLEDLKSIGYNLGKIEKTDTIYF